MTRSRYKTNFCIESFILTLGEQKLHKFSLILWTLYFIKACINIINSCCQFNIRKLTSLHARKSTGYRRFFEVLMQCNRNPHLCRLPKMLQNLISMMINIIFLLSHKTNFNCNPVNTDHLQSWLARSTLKCGLRVRLAQCQLLHIPLGHYLIIE